MKVKDSVFGSKWERQLYKTIESSWPEKVTIYHNLPFLSVIDWSGARLESYERQVLKSTSVDYTACDRDTDRPLMSVEFDGLGHGYSKGPMYVEVVGGSDPYRSNKLNLKLRMADQVDYPLLVVSYDGASPVTDSDQVTITHAIMGECMMHMKVEGEIQRRASEAGIFDAPEETRQSIFQEIIIDVEVEMEFEWNPLVRLTASAMTAALDHGMTTWSQTQLTDPPMPSLEGIPDPADAIRAKAVHLFVRTRRHGCRVTADHPNGSVTREAWVRNIVGPGVTTWSIATDLAKLYAFRAVVAELPNGPSTRAHFKPGGPL